MEEVKQTPQEIKSVPNNAEGPKVLSPAEGPKVLSPAEGPKVLNHAEGQNILSPAEEEKYVRPSWDEYFLNLIEPIGKRATCDRGRSGSIIVSTGHTIIATGYVGSPPGQPHCDEVGHMMNTVIHEDGSQSQHCVRTLHAEENAILQCAKDGIKLEGATIYSKMVPCYNCAMRIVRVGIKRVVSQKKYHADGLSRKLFKDAGVELVVIDDTIEQYTKQ